MNRFSPNQTLSNFATAVRETVDSVNKIFFVATLLLVIGAFSAGSTAHADPVKFDPRSSGVPSVGVNGMGYQVPETAAERKARIDQQVKDINSVCDKTSATYNPLSCEVYRRDAGLGDDRSCESAVSNIDKAGDRARESCQLVGIGDYSKCVQKISYCEDADTKVSEYEEDNEGPAYCDKILANSCPSLPSFNIGADYKNDKKDAERDRKEAKKDLDDLMDEDRKNKKDLAKTQLELQEQQENGEAAYQESQSKLNKKMVDALEGISNAKKQAFKQAQEVTDALEIEYVNMRAEARNAANNIILAEEKKNLSCTQSADSSYKQAEAARLAAEKKGRKNLGSGISGAAKRTKTAILRQQQIDYQKFFAECMGKSTEASMALRAAQLDKEAKEKMIAEKSTILEKKRVKLQADLEQMEADSKNQQSKVVDDVQAEFTRMQTEKARVDAQNQRRLAQMANDNLQANLSMQNRITQANQDLMKTQSEAALAVSRMSCAGRTAQKSSTAVADTDRGFANARKDVENLQRACKSFKSGCGEAPSQCTDFATWGKNNKKHQPSYQVK